MNHYPHHVGDYLRKTVGLSWLEDCAYRRLLDRYYIEEHPLPLDPKECHRAASATSRAERAAVDYVLSRFFERRDDGWHNARADEEIAAFRIRAERARENGMQGAERQRSRARSGPEAGCDSDPTSGANQEPRTKNQRSLKPKAQPAAAPDWLPVEAWDRYREMRKALRKPLTPYGEGLAIGKLALLREQGHDPTAVLNESVLRSWLGLFPLKPDDARGNGGAQAPRATTVAQQRSQAVNAYLDEGQPNERIIQGTAERVDRETLRALPGDVRQPV